MAQRLNPLISTLVASRRLKPPRPSVSSSPKQSRFRIIAAKMATIQDDDNKIAPSPIKIFDSHLHVWASPQEAADKYPYFPGQEPTLPGNVDFLLQCMEEAGVDGALVVQPINHKFDHSLVTSVLRNYPSKFVGCCLANPAEDGSGVQQLEHLVTKDGYRAVRFNPYLWPSGQQMTNEIGKAMFSKAGELRVPVGFMCMKGLNLHISEIEKLCSEFPSTVVLLDHLAFCKQPTNEEENSALSKLLKLSRFPQVPVLLFLLIFIGSRVVESAPPSFACDSTDPATAGLPFCQPSLPIPARVADLIGRLTLPEKVGMLGDNAAAVPRLGIKGYEWWSEALHGVSNVGPGTRFGGPFPGATMFPQVITTAASFNSSLWESIGRVVSDEARAMYNGGAAGLTFWSPNVNIFRDPRWGRGQETPGEDPLIVGKYAARYVKGLQGDDPTRLKVAACCKHFTAYDLDNWNGVDRFHFNALVSKQDREDTFDAPFRTCVKEGNVASVMCSYNQVNGVPTCADPNLLHKTIRGKWKLNGYIVSDCDSVGVYFNSQHYTATPEEAAADAIKAGLDLDCGPFLALHTQDAIKSGALRDADVDKALANTVAVQMRLGMFDSAPTAQLFGNLGPADVCTPAHQQLALEAARQGIVLLKNQGPSLPLSPQRHRTVAVIGPNSNATVTMIGNYAGIACGYTSPVDGIARYTTTIPQPGCVDVACVDDKLFAGAVDAASRADATVMIMGLDQSIEAETVDRAGLILPGRQQDLITRVAAASRGPTILVLMSGGPIDISFAKNDPRVASIVWAGYPGQAGGTAIADVVFGTTNPGGKLPMTWYPQDYLAKVPMTTMAMRPDPRTGYPGRTYRFYKGPVVYPFGHGMSYTNIVHTIADAPTAFVVPLDGHRNAGNASISGKAVRVTHARCAGLSIGVHVDVRNDGSTDGAHTLLVYSTPPAAQHWAPHKQLVAFEKVHVAARSQQRVRIGIHVCKYLSVVDRSGIRRIPMGDHRLHVGGLKHRVALQPSVVGVIKT